MHLRKRMIVNDMLVCPKSPSDVKIPASIPDVGMGSHIVFSKRFKTMGAVLKNSHVKYFPFLFREGPKEYSTSLARN